MKTEFLKGLGLEQDTIDKIFAEHGKALKALQDENATLKTDKAAVDAELETTKTSLANANTEIASYKGMNIEEIQKNAADWEQKAKTLEEKAKADVEAVRFENDLTQELVAGGAKNPKAVRALLNSDDLKRGEDGKISGLAAQLESVRKDNDYLFHVQPAGGAGFDDKSPPDVTTSTNDYMNSLIRGARGENV